MVIHLDRAFAHDDRKQREILFKTLSDFAKENPGKDWGDVYWFEQEAVEEFLADRFSQDAEFAPGMAELADERLSALPPVPEGEHDRYRLTKWKYDKVKSYLKHLNRMAE